MYTCNNCGGRPVITLEAPAASILPTATASILHYLFHSFQLLLNLFQNHTHLASVLLWNKFKIKEMWPLYNTLTHTDNSQYRTETHRKQRNPYTNTDTVTKRHKHYTGSASIQQNRWTLQMTKEERVSKQIQTDM